MKVIGRKKEQSLLSEAYNSNEAQFIALFGRRRVGKTFLIEGCYGNKDGIFFHASGIKDASLQHQLQFFIREIEDTFYKEYKATKLEVPSNWLKAFDILNDAIKNNSTKKRIVLFLDEVPWMATPKSLLLQALDYFWNRHWRKDKRIRLVICGSAATWIIKNVLNNKGGLHNRVTVKLHLHPFNLIQTAEFLKKKHGIKLAKAQLVQLYMSIGGIPYYLNMVKKGLSYVQIIDELLFHADAQLADEFDNLFSSLFKNFAAHDELIKIIAAKLYGVDRVEIGNKVKLSQKGSLLTQRLEELEKSDFITSFLPYGKQRGLNYRLTDEYIAFYLTWLAKSNQKSILPLSWVELAKTPKFRIWSGFAFEILCYKQVEILAERLQIPKASLASTWKHQAAKNSKDQGAQIDLLFDRADDAITICEIKYTDKPFTIDKEYYHKLLRKIEVFKKVTRTKKQIFVAFISANGLKKTIYSEEIVTGLVTLDDLFKN